MSDPLAAHNSNEVAWWEALAVDIPPRPSAINPSDATTFDVIVVGSGMAGLTAAVFTQEQGRSVLVLEAAKEGGGTTYKSGAGMWVPDNSIRRLRGLAGERDWALDHMAKYAFPDEYDPAAERLGLEQRDYDLITTYYDVAGHAMDELQRIGIGLMEFPSLCSEFEAMVEYHDDIEHGFGTHLSPRQRDGSWGTGFHIIDQLAAISGELGVELRMGHRVREVVQNDAGEVIGVRAETASGEVELLSRQGVVFATGGYAHNEELASKYFPAGLYGSCAVPTSRGDFVAIAEQIGAELGNMGEGWGTEHPLEVMLQDGREVENHIGVFPGDSVLMVNTAGKRVINEKLIYHERSKVHFVRDDDGGLPNHLTFLIFDDFVALDTSPAIDRWPDPNPSNYWVITADTLDGLADAIDARLESYGERIGGVRLEPDFKSQLRHTTERFNEFARNGKDEDFHRGETRAIEIEWTGPWHAVNDKNRTMWPLSGGPYHAIMVVGSVLDTNGGARTNEKGQVLTTDGTPIPGLYGAGNCVSSPAGKGYWSGGSTLGPAATFAWIVAQNIVHEPTRTTTAESAVD